MKHIKRIVTLLCILGCVLALVTCAKKPSSIVLMHDKGGNPDYRPFYDQMGALSKTATGVSFTQSPYPDTTTYQAAVRAALPTDKAPDLFTWWSTYRMKDLVDAGLVADLSDLWNKHKELPQGLRDAMSFDGKAYALPYVVEYWGVWYNKETFAKYNLSVPTTWDEFMTVCATLKKNGVTPMVQSVSSGWTTFILFEEMVARTDPQLYVDLCEGKVKYSDPAVKAAFKVWADLIAKGYFTDPATDFFADAPRLFEQGKAAMIPAGSWYLTTLTGQRRRRGQVRHLHHAADQCLRRQRRDPGGQPHPHLGEGPQPRGCQEGRGLVDEPGGKLRVRQDGQPVPRQPEGGRQLPAPGQGRVRQD